MPRGKSFAAQRGFSYLIVLFALAVFGIGLAKTGEQWSRTAQREKENELIRHGTEVVRAIERYYQRSPGAQRRLPASLEELVEDKRFVGTQRHLRRIPVDPFTRRADWELVRASDGSIAGIASRHAGTPLRQTGFDVEGMPVAAATRYADWKFVYQPRESK